MLHADPNYVLCDMRMRIAEEARGRFPLQESDILHSLRERLFALILQ